MQPSECCYLVFAPRVMRVLSLICLHSEVQVSAFMLDTELEISYFILNFWLANIKMKKNNSIRNFLLGVKLLKFMEGNGLLIEDVNL